ASAPTANATKPKRRKSRAAAPEASAEYLSQGAESTQFPIAGSDELVTNSYKADRSITPANPLWNEADHVLPGSAYPLEIASAARDSKPGVTVELADSDSTIRAAETDSDDQSEQIVRVAAEEDLNSTWEQASMVDVESDPKSDLPKDDGEASADAALDPNFP